MSYLHGAGRDASAPGRARIRFHGDLRHLVRRGNRPAPGADPDAPQVTPPDAPLVVDYPLERRASVKDVLEALGPPHTEIGKLRVDGRAVDFRHLLMPGQEADAWPVRPPLDVTMPSLLRPVPLPRLAFVVDVNVGRLARRLRLLGLDAAFDPAWDAPRLAALARDEGRVVLTADRLLLRRNAVSHGRLVRAIHPDEQLLEVLAFFGLSGPFATFTRCLDCNGLLQPVPKAEVMDRLEPLTKRHYHAFRICPGCGRIYWRGSHHERMLADLERLGLAH